VKWLDDENILFIEQQGEGLGERMKNTIECGFKSKKERVVIIGSDIPAITPEIIISAFDNLIKNEMVIGPAEDGGFYLIGLSSYSKKKIGEIYLKI